MVMQDRGNRLAIAAWDVESLRLTAFPIPASPIEDVGWWKSLMGEPPEVEILHPRVGGKRMEGTFEQGRLVIQTSPTRIDLFAIPSPAQEAPSGFSKIGKFEQILGRFDDEVMHRWLTLDSCPEIRCVAFWAVLLSPVDSKVSGYRQLAAYLPSVTVDPEHSTDLFYQINRPRESATGIPDLKINRFSKWFVAQMFTADFVWEPTRILTHDAPQGYLACCLELNISTDAERREPLPRETVSNIWQELLNLGKDIVIDGDQP
jgi:hypothetical protein